jgi:putative nucleotidyltransferase with HDIG domain
MIKAMRSVDLEIGMYVVRLDRAWLETPFFAHRFLIKEKQQIDELCKYCLFVYIDTQKGLEGSASSAVEDPSKKILEELQSIENRNSETGTADWISKSPPGSISSLGTEHPIPIGVNDASIGEEIRRAIKIQGQAKLVISRILTEVRMGLSVTTTEAREVVSNVVDSVLRNSNALVFLSQLRGRDEYTSRHSISVCALSVAFGHFLGLEKERLQCLGVGGLLHDIGKMKIPLEVLKKPGKLTAPEYEQIKKHVEYGLIALSEAKDVPEQSLQVVAEHHERSNGSGYPSHLDGTQITLFGAIAAIVDVYDAITTDRTYRKRMTPHEAIRSMFQWGDPDFKKELLQMFIRCMGIYPAGSLVQINHSQVGVVVAANPWHALKPTILLVLDENRLEYSSPKTIDLAGDGMEKLTITSVLDPDVERINIRGIIGESLLL